MTRKRTSFSSSRIDDIKAKAEDRGITFNDLLDRYVLLASILDDKAAEGKKFFVEQDGKRELIPVKELLETKETQSA